MTDGSVRKKSMSLIRYTFGLECYKTSSLPSNSTDIQTRRHNVQLRVHLHELTGLHTRKTYFWDFIILFVI